MLYSKQLYGKGRGAAHAAFFNSRSKVLTMDIMQQLRQIAQEREIPVEELLREIEEALAASYKKFIGVPHGVDLQVSVKLDDVKGWTASVEKEVVGVVSDPNYQIGATEAKKRDAALEIGDTIAVEVDPNRFGRIAAQTFKQVLTQKMREAETRQIQDVFQEKMGEIVAGRVTRRESQNVYVDVNRVEAELPKREQVPTEPYRTNDLLDYYVLRVDDTGRRIRVILSRTHPNLVRKLFEREVPEIGQGIVSIVGITREPGQRSKVAVTSADERVDAVGSCLGPRGSRVQAITEKLLEEKVDVVAYSEDPQTYITNALSPAKVNSIKLVNADVDEDRSAYVVVPDNQLSLAIGKGGQNVRLAARLTGWKIDIRSEAQAASEGKPK